MARQRIPFANRWMFNRVMTDEGICRDFIRVVCGVDAERVEYVNAEQAVEPGPKSRGIRMDVYVRGGGEVYDIEMQACPEPALGRRFRYYQSALDTRELGPGRDYDALPESFIVFLCTGDPLGAGLPVYTVERGIAEAPGAPVGDGSHWLALNASAWEGCARGELRNLLQYVDTGEANGDLAAEIDGEVSSVNADMGWSDGYFSISTIEEDDARRRRIELRQARAEGLEEGESGFAALAGALLDAGRADDLRRAAADTTYRGTLMQELRIDRP